MVQVNIPDPIDGIEFIEHLGTELGVSMYLKVSISGDKLNVDDDGLNSQDVEDAITSYIHGSTVIESRVNRSTMGAFII